MHTTMVEMCSEAHQICSLVHSISSNCILNKLSPCLLAKSMRPAWTPTQRPSSQHKCTEICNGQYQNKLLVNKCICILKSIHVCKLYKLDVILENVSATAITVCWGLKFTGSSQWMCSTICFNPTSLTINL